MLGTAASGGGRPCLALSVCLPTSKDLLGAPIAASERIFSMSKPIIAVNTDFRSAKHDAPAFAYVAAGYFDADGERTRSPLIERIFQSAATRKTES